MKYKGLTIRKTGKFYRVEGMRRYFPSIAAAKRAINHFEHIQFLQDKPQIRPKGKKRRK